MKLSDLINKVDNSPLKTDPQVYLFKTHDGVVIGKIIPSVVEKLHAIDWLEVQESPKQVRVKNPDNLTEKFAIVTSEWREKEVFDCLKGWRSELYTCFTTGGSKYFDIERSAACLFGIVTYGVHITGFCPSLNKIWVPRRAATKQTYPLMLDNTVAGGLGNGVGFAECAIKECGEEAGLSPEYLKDRLKPVGVVTYEFIDPETGYYQPEVECVFDLNMDPTTVSGEATKPQPTDGEVQEFYLWSYQEVLEHMLAGEFKYNCALVLIDFFMRHGVITAESEPEYIDLAARCHRLLDYPLKSN